jgi:hypothetical protein
MKNRNNLFTTTLVALAFAFAPVVKAGPRLDGGPGYLASQIVNANSDAGAKFDQPTDILPVVSISFASVGLTLNQTARLNLVNMDQPNGITVRCRFIDASGIRIRCHANARPAPS